MASALCVSPLGGTALAWRCLRRPLHMALHNLQNKRGIGLEGGRKHHSGGTHLQFAAPQHRTAPGFLPFHFCKIFFTPMGGATKQNAVTCVMRSQANQIMSQMNHNNTKSRFCSSLDIGTWVVHVANMTDWETCVVGQYVNSQRLLLSSGAPIEFRSKLIGPQW